MRFPPRAREVKGASGWLPRKNLLPPMVVPHDRPAPRRRAGSENVPCRCGDDAKPPRAPTLPTRFPTEVGNLRNPLGNIHVYTYVCIYIYI